ncbi:hypothetical protein C5O19_09425 [Siphonobacter curvatus]|uniref:Uncharacterized protein n=2 Tax=Siphonobacter curvatus TaxID=2094562 RepID=A0A2S7IQ36_9BACT|nr:hypothetical protein C5O19_09425 [Siphonobacter curvatus]
MFADFKKDILIIDTDKSKSVDVSSLNRIGKPVKSEIKLIFSNQKGDFETAPGGRTKDLPEEGFYRVRAKVNDKYLQGESAAIIIKSSNSLLFNDTTLQVFNIFLTKYPTFFTRTNIQSQSIQGNVFLVKPTNNNGKIDLQYSTLFSQVLNIETENNQIISSNGSTLSSVKEGFGRWRPIYKNFKGPWYASQVFVDFSGIWYCESDKKGNEISLNIPFIPEKVFYDGSAGGPFEIFKYYKINDRQVAYAQLNLGKAQIKNKFSPFNIINTQVEIGPVTDCLICTNTPTTPQRQDWPFGALNLLNQNRYGTLFYSSKDKFILNDNENSRIEFIRKNAQFEEQDKPEKFTIEGVEVYGTKGIKGINLIGEYKAETKNHLSYQGVKYPNLPLILNPDNSGTFVENEDYEVLIVSTTTNKTPFTWRILTDDNGNPLMETRESSRFKGKSGLISITIHKKDVSKETIFYEIYKDNLERYGSQSFIWPIIIDESRNEIIIERFSGILSSYNEYDIRVKRLK